MLRDCVRNFRNPETDRVIEMYELARCGAWPVLAGTLDQTRSFLQAFRFLRQILPE